MVEARLPSLQLVQWDALEGALFHLVEARIDWTDGTRSTGWGRDADLETARAKSVGEAVERHGYQRRRNALEASASSLERFIDPADLVRYAPQQYAAPGFALTPFDPTDARRWVPAARVLEGPPTWVLADCVYSPRAFDDDYRSRLVTHATTSGCASGDSVEVAGLRATLELVERDTFMRHWFAQQAGLAIAPDSLPGDAAERMARLAQTGCATGLSWLHAGLHPTWLAWAQHPGLHFTAIGTASGLDGAAALDTALNELETMAFARVEGAGWHPVDPAAVRTPADHAALYATPGYFRRADALLHGAPAQRRFDDACESFQATPDAFYEKLARAGHVPYHVELSVDEALRALTGGDIHVVRAIVPRLIPIAFGWGCMPLGMDRWQRSAPDLLHPFS